MIHTSEKLPDILLEDIKERPELIAEFLFSEQDVSIILEKRGNVVHCAYLRTYDKNSTRLLKEAQEEYLQKEREGYTREQAFHDFMEVQDEITEQL